jgi:CBS domain-containing protein
MTTCRELMGKVSRMCTTTDTVFEASQIMLNHNMSAVPVVASKHNNELIGLVAERDIVLRVVGEGLPAQTRVGDIMTVNIATCAPDDDVEKALKIMNDLQIHHVPIVDEKGNVIGMVNKDVAA